MKKLISVTCPELENKRHYFTSGKSYKVIETINEHGFVIINDLGTESVCLSSNPDGQIENKKWILNYEPDTTERSKEIVSQLLLKGFHSNDTLWIKNEEYIQTAKDFGLEELAKEMENCLK